MNVLLIGMRASGKSTIGALLASELRRGFVELDDVTAGLLNAPSAGDAIRAAGIGAFREAELRALRTAMNEQSRVISLGGGTPTAPGAPELIGSARHAGAALVIYLDADAARIRARIAADGVDKRPPILGRDAIEEVDELVRRRAPVYLAMADLRVEVRDGDPRVIARTIGAFVTNRERAIAG